MKYRYVCNNINTRTADVLFLSCVKVSSFYSRLQEPGWEDLNISNFSLKYIVYIITYSHYIYIYIHAYYIYICMYNLAYDTKYRCDLAVAGFRAFHRGPPS